MSKDNAGAVFLVAWILLNEGGIVLGMLTEYGLFFAVPLGAALAQAISFYIARIPSVHSFAWFFGTLGIWVAVLMLGWENEMTLAAVVFTLGSELLAWFAARVRSFGLYGAVSIGSMYFIEDIAAFATDLAPIRGYWGSIFSTGVVAMVYAVATGAAMMWLLNHASRDSTVESESTGHSGGNGEEVTHRDV